MADQDPTRDAPEPPTATHAPDSATPSFVPQLSSTVGQKPEQIAALAGTNADIPSIPGYEILGELGHGGMGIVYRAREIALDRDVAIKLLRAEYRPDSPSTRRFLEEARITGQLQHPAIPPVHQIGTLGGGRLFLAMKMIKGETLSELLTAEPTNLGRFVAVFAQVCQALAYAHSRKVIHRDLKPANVMVGAFGEVQVMDWGLAKLLLSGGHRPPETEAIEDERTVIRTTREVGSATQGGSVMGTPAYMAPEQAQGAVEEIDERSDVFGLGAMLCAILTGKPPYSGPTTEAIRLKAVRGETADAFARLDGCGADPELVALGKKCLATDRDARPRDAGEVVKAMSAHLAAVAERARQAELSLVRADERRKRRRVQVVLAAAVVALLALVGFGIALVSLWRDANRARDEAVAQTGVAEGARDEAQRQEDLAREAQRELERASDKLVRVEYGRTMQVAHQEWRENNIAVALALLNSTDPKLRGWEWNYVYRLCHSDLLTLEAHKGMVRSASFSEDRKWIVTAGGDNTAKVWDAATGKLHLTLEGHGNSVTTVAFSRDSSRIVTASNDRSAKVWDASTGNVLQHLPHPNTIVDCVSFSPDRSRVVTGSQDGKARVWDANTGKLLLTFEKHRDWVMSAAFSPNGKRIITGSRDGIAQVWDPETGAVERTLITGMSVTSVSFSPDGSQLLAAGGQTLNEGLAKVWSANSGTELLTLRGHTGFVRGAAFSADGSRIVTASWDRTAKVWSASTGAELLTLRGHTGNVRSAAFSPDGSRVITGSEDGTAKVWDAQVGAEAQSIKLSGIEGTPLSPDGSRAVVKGEGELAEVQDTNTGAVICTLKGHPGGGGLRSAAFSPDMSLVVTTANGRTAKVWDANTGREIITLAGHKDQVTSVSFRWSRVVTTSNDGTVKVWDARTWAELFTLGELAHAVRSAALSPDGAQLVTGCADGTVRVWDARSRNLVHALNAHTGALRSVSFSPNGSQFVTASWDGTAKVWDARTWAELFALKGHTGELWFASFSPDGARIVTGSGDKTAKVWDAKTGAELLTLKGHTHRVESVYFSSDGSRVFTASKDGTAMIWDARPFRDSRPPDKR